MIGIFTFPEIFQPEGCLFPLKLKTTPTPHAEAPLPKSPGDAFTTNARATEDLESLARVLKKYPDLRIALYKALEEDGAFNSFA